MKEEESDKIVVKNFWNIKNRDVRLSELGWQERDFLDAGSDDPETIFRYYIDQVGFNMEFYYVDDGCFYVIFTERLPIKVYRKLKNENWDGKYVCDSAIGAIETHHGGEEIFCTRDVTKIWTDLKIRGKSIGEVLERSFILTLD